MKIAIVCPPLTGRGGMETCLRSFTLGALQAGHSVRLLALSPSRLDDSWQMGLPYTELTSGSGSPLSQLTQGVRALERAYRAFRPDVTLSLYPSSLAVIRLAQVLALHRQTVASWLHFPLHRSEKAFLLRAADLHLCVSTGVMRALQTRLGIPARKMALVFNGTRLEGAQEPKRSAPGAPLQLVHIGRLQFGGQKRSDDVLRAMAEAGGDCRCHFIGAGDVAELQTLAAELGVAARCAWTGWLKAPWTAVEMADALVLSSDYEAFGVILIEALARGVPCISADCEVGPDDIVQLGVNGWLYPSGDVSALARRIAELMADKGRLPAAAAVKQSATAFDMEAVTGRILLALAGQPVAI